MLRGLVQGAGGGGGTLATILNNVRTRIVDFVGIGDSTQLHNGDGWDDGWAYALGQIAPMWATGIISFGENQGNGAGTGFNYAIGYNAGAGFSYSGAPAGLDAYLNTGQTTSPANYIYLPTGSSLAAGIVLTGLATGSTCAPPLDPTDALASDIYYGSFTSGAGGFQQYLRIEFPPYSTIVTGSAVNTNTGAYGLLKNTLAIAGDATRTGAGYGLKSGTITGPFFGLYNRIRRTASTCGYSYSTLDGHGGGSLRVMANDIASMSSTAISTYFSILRNDQIAQGMASPMICLTITSGANDRSDNNLSVGPSPATSSTAAGYIDNLTAIINTIKGVWTANGWPQSELYWVLSVSVPISIPDDANYVAYRDALRAFSATLTNAAYIDFSSVLSYNFLTTNSLWYTTPGDAHLTRQGYEIATQRALGLLPATPSGQIYASLPLALPGVAPKLITDCTVNTWGATAAGGGAYTVYVGCKTSGVWTVMG